MKSAVSDSDSIQTAGLKGRNGKHNIIHVCLIALTFVAFLIMALFNFSASKKSLGIFKKPFIQNVSDENPVDITPAGWTFSTWGIIYMWLTAWLIFNIVIIFKTTDNGRVYQEPPVLTPIFHLIMIANFIVNISWLFAWEREEFTASFILIAFISMTLYAALFISHRNIFNARLYIGKIRIYIWLYRILVNNGLAFYATWVTIGTFINLSIAITYDWEDASKQAYFRSTSGTISLSILSVLLVVYFVLDVIVLEKYLRYTFSPYVQMAIAFAGILSKLWDSESPSTTAIFTLVLIIIAPCLMFLTKIVVSIYKHKKEKQTEF